MKRYTHVYTGNGKGKTTAALGLELRSAGAGYKVYIGQFIKGMFYSELNILEKRLIENITIKQYGRGCFIDRVPTSEDIECAIHGFDELEQIVKSCKYDVVILDEANIAMFFKLIPVDRFVKLIKEKPDTVELILTGRYAPDEILAVADLVTEMKEVKHYYNTLGVEAREGIEK